MSACRLKTFASEGSNGVASRFIPLAEPPNNPLIPHCVFIAGIKTPDSPFHPELAVRKTVLERNGAESSKNDELLPDETKAQR
jgi:hypothetical protein